MSPPVLSRQHLPAGTLHQHPVADLVGAILVAFHPVAGDPRVRHHLLGPGAGARRRDGAQPRVLRRIPRQAPAGPAVEGEAHVARSLGLAVGAVPQHRRVRPAELLPVAVQGAHDVHVLGAVGAVRRRAVLVPGGHAGRYFHQRHPGRALPVARGPAGVAVALHPVAGVPVARPGASRSGWRSPARSRPAGW